MASKPSDSAILNLGDIGEENAFSTSITPSMSSTVHSFEDKIPDSALDVDEEGMLPIGLWPDGLNITYFRNRHSKSKCYF